LKEIIVLYGAKNLSDNTQSVNFKISIGFFCLQENPALLVPWMVYVIVFMIATIVLYIIYAAEYFSVNDAAIRTGNIIGAFIHLCK